MFQFTWLSSRLTARIPRTFYPVFSIDKKCGVGFPIRTPPDQCQFDGSPEHFAATRVLHRLRVPRYPPCALCILTHLTSSQDIFYISNISHHINHLIGNWVFTCNSLFNYQCTTGLVLPTKKRTLVRSFAALMM